jgi:hypothetical protein
VSYMMLFDCSIIADECGGGVKEVEWWGRAYVGLLGGELSVNGFYCLK